MGDRKVGTEHLAIALLEEPDVAGALQCDSDSARAALAELDRSALAGFGVEIAAGPPPPPARVADRPSRPTFKELLSKRLPMTPAAKSVLRDSSREMRRPGHRHPGPQNVMAALLELREPDPSAELFGALGVDSATARRRLRAAR
jgi:hypothetical protein